MKRTSLGKFIAHVKADSTLFIDGYFLIIGASNDYFISLNGHSQLYNDSAVAYNNVNGTWYFKFI